MNREPTRDFLERLRRVKASSPTPDEADRLRTEWLADLGKLYATLETYLRPAVEEKLLRVERGETRLIEEPLGDYTAPTLTIHMPGHLTVSVEPVGITVLGGHTGRVDLVCGPNKARLLREADGTWALGLPSIQFGRLVFDLKPLTTESLLAVLDGLTA